MRFFCVFFFFFNVLRCFPRQKSVSFSDVHLLMYFKTQNRFELENRRNGVRFVFFSLSL